jgi:hypothetical protein
MIEGFRFAFDPMVAWWMIAGLAVLGLAAIAAHIALGGRSVFWRCAGLALILLGLSGPSRVAETRSPERDVVAIITDQSDSLSLTSRSEAAAAVGADIAARAGKLENLDVRTRSVPSGADGTELFSALEDLMADVPADRRAGAVMITDGEVHDIPSTRDAQRAFGPVTTVLVGDPSRSDRRLELVSAPPFAIVGQPTDVVVKLVDPDGAALPVTVSINGVVVATAEARNGAEIPIKFTLDRRGDATVSLSVPPRAGDLSTINDTAAFNTQGVKDRLRVLLVTGEPYAGARIWRNFLKSDPSVDLVHFTILRPGFLNDNTPIEELSLIAFPTRELFEEKLDEFDLIIFDRYRNRGVLPPYYLENVAGRVERGGAILIVSGPADVGTESLTRTPLASVLPATPTGVIRSSRYVPALTPDGQRHPITAGLPQAPATIWGPWVRYIEASAGRGQTLMSGPGGGPLLVVSKVGEGRVAQLFSDQVWLWARGWQGGGPHGELLRRLAHWLMQEPELEENRLTLTAQNGELRVARHAFSGEPGSASVTAPSGAVTDVPLLRKDATMAEGALPSREPGLWKAEADGQTAWAAVGPTSAKEAADLAATDKLMRPVARATGGNFIELGERPAAGQPSVQRVRDGASAPAGTIGIPLRGGYTVTSARTEPLGPGLLWVAFGFLIMILAWRREAR